MVIRRADRDNDSDISSVATDASVGLAQAAIDENIVDNQLKVEEEPWMKSYWRPAMAWLYMAICAFDFIIAPILTMFLSGLFHFTYVPWKSITLDNGGMIHFAFGAILGVAAWTRGAYEKRFTGNQ